MTQPEGVRQNLDYRAGQPGFTPQPANQPPFATAFPQPPTQQFGALPPQPPYGMAQPSWQAPGYPGAGVPPLSRSPWFKRKRFVIPIGVLTLLFLAAAVSPKQNTATSLTAASAAAGSSAAGASAAAAASSAAASSAAAASSSAAAAASSAAEASTAAAARSAAAAASKAAVVPKVAPQPAPKVAPAPKPAPAPNAAPAPAPAPNGSVSQQNAVRSAKDYLSMTAFSRSGLIAQLNYEGYSTSDSTWAVDSLNVDWNLQAAKSAKEYLSMTSFSHSGLVQQLEYEGYSAAQAEYGVSQTGL